RVVAAGSAGRRNGARGFAAPAAYAGVRRLVLGVLPGGRRRARPRARRRSPASRARGRRPCVASGGEATAGASGGRLARVVAAGSAGRRIGAWGFAAPASCAGVRRLVHGVLPGGRPWRAAGSATTAARRRPAG